MLDIGVIIPELQKYGGAERVLIECLRRWQKRHRLTLYSTQTNSKLLAESGVKNVALRSLTRRFEGDHATVLNATLLPKIWEGEIGSHDVYHAHLWPTHLLNLHPLVWYPHEPLRLLNDLAYSFSRTGESAIEPDHFLHFYPAQNYTTVGDPYYEAMLRTMQAMDLTGHPDRIVANSRFTAQSLEAAYGIAVNDVVYPGATVSEFLAPKQP